MAIFKEIAENEYALTRSILLLKAIMYWKTARDRITLILFTIKSHTGFRLISKRVTLNDHERCRRALSLR